MPHCTPPFVPPLPTRACQSTLPLASGSRAYTIPDFCPASRTSRPPASFSNITDDPKSKSGPGQFLAFAHPPLKMSPGVTWFDQRILPVERSGVIVPRGDVDRLAFQIERRSRPHTSSSRRLDHVRLPKLLAILNAVGDYAAPKRTAFVVRIDWPVFLPRRHGYIY